MHELGVVFHVIKKVNKVAVENGIESIARVSLDIGEVSTVIPSYLLDCWKWAVKKEPILESAELVISKIKAETMCSDCGKTYETVKFGRTCPNCKSENTYLVTGNEFIIKDIAIRED